jgi:hypothetical protein
MAMRENSSFPGPPDQDGELGHILARHALAPHAMRIGDAERDVAAQELGEHFVAGRLTLDELHQRLGSVLSARTRGQLTRVMADLPTPRRPKFDDQWRPAVPASPGSVPSAPALTASARRERVSGDTVSRLAAVALLLFAMLIWLFTVMMFASLG